MFDQSSVCGAVLSLTGVPKDLLCLEFAVLGCGWAVTCESSCGCMRICIDPPVLTSWVLSWLQCRQTRQAIKHVKTWFCSII